jgi:predicted regulator of Ras-like GTPase activity (Roadblock/LC7/MglB family)
MMVINNTISNISFRPLVSFNGLPVTLEIENKATKVKVSSTVTPVIVGTRVTLALPDISTLNLHEMNEINVRVKQGYVLLFEYLAYYIEGSVNEYRQWKQWDSTTLNSKEWITL